MNESSVQPKSQHFPGQPSEACPKKLEEIADSFRHPLVKSCGITCTEEGDWALFLGVSGETKVPIGEAEEFGFPTVYVVEPDEPIRIQETDS